MPRGNITECKHLGRRRRCSPATPPAQDYSLQHERTQNQQQNPNDFIQKTGKRQSVSPKRGTSAGEAMESHTWQGSQISAPASAARPGPATASGHLQAAGEETGQETRHKLGHVTHENRRLLTAGSWRPSQGTTRHTRLSGEWRKHRALASRVSHLPDLCRRRQPAAKGDTGLTRATAFLR